MQQRSSRRRPVRFRTTFHNCVRDLFEARGWVETESDTDWDVAWVDKDWIRENLDALSGGFAEHQRINHFRNHYVRVPRSHETGSLSGRPYRLHAADWLGVCARVACRS